MNDLALTEDEIRRYSRQLILSNWSAKKQLRLRTLTIRVSHPVTALYLGAAGVGEVVLEQASRDQLPEELLRELCPQTLFSVAEIPRKDRPIDCAVLSAEERPSAELEIPTFIVSDDGIIRALQGKPALVLPFAEGYRAGDRSCGGLGSAALGALALLNWLAESAE